MGVICQHFSIGRFCIKIPWGQPNRFSPQALIHDRLGTRNPVPPEELSTRDGSWWNKYSRFLALRWRTLQHVLCKLPGPSNCSFILCQASFPSLSPFPTLLLVPLRSSTGTVSLSASQKIQPKTSSTNSQPSPPSYEPPAQLGSSSRDLL